MTRYKVFNGSITAHCCFEASVVDTRKPHIIDGEHYKGVDGQYHYDPVCECFDKSDAEMICNVLNDAGSPISLDQLKAKWQAEALEELLQNTSQFREANPVRGLAGSMADELRQQAEGGGV